MTQKEITRHYQQVLGFKLAKAGFLAALPYLARALAAFGFGSIGDYLRKKSFFTVTTMRKSFCLFCKYTFATRKILLARCHIRVIELLINFPSFKLFIVSKSQISFFAKGVEARTKKNLRSFRNHFLTTSCHNAEMPGMTGMQTNDNH